MLNLFRESSVLSRSLVVLLVGTCNCSCAEIMKVSSSRCRFHISSASIQVAVPCT
ncbi:hypothetical protein KC19_1G115400 [Ceratodon purpureus]|uniref:Secreted protein n=1 Tax=Ceratodon purpureus TaxID=3225 RepID=A0A8T0J637_CERPU|nr:hypothetical protein KC19_1G115400 [Ceratodon purpureus]